jgi:hypothetical protein
MTHTLELTLTDEETARDEALFEAENELQAEMDEIKSNLIENEGRCSQCKALVINGIYCHETGCPVDRKLVRLQKQLDSLYDF